MVLVKMVVVEVLAYLLFEHNLMGKILLLKVISMCCHTTNHFHRLTKQVFFPLFKRWDKIFLMFIIFHYPFPKLIFFTNYFHHHFSNSIIATSISFHLHTMDPIIHISMTPKDRFVIFIIFTSFVVASKQVLKMETKLLLKTFYPKVFLFNILNWAL